MEQTNNLKGYDALNRAKALMTESKNTEKSLNSNFVKLIKEGNDGYTYAIIKENSKYFLKKAYGKYDLVLEDFKYLMGDTQKNHYMFESFAPAANSLNNVLFGLNEMGCVDQPNKDMLTSDNIEVLQDNNLEEEVEEDVDFEEDDAIDINEMLSEMNPIDDMEESCLSKMDEMTDFIDSSITEKYTLKIDSPEEPAPLEFDGEDDSNTADALGGGDFEMEDDEAKDESPFEDEPFDAGVEANEEEEPEKYLQQLAGKLATSLRKYQEANNGDVDTKKFVANTVLSAVDTEGMEQSDINDIKGKLEQSSDEDNPDGEDNPNGGEFESSNDEETDAPQEIEGIDDGVDEITEAYGDNEEEENNQFQSAIDRLKSSSAKRSQTQHKERDGAEERAAKRKQMDIHKPLDSKENTLQENYNKNMDEYLCSLVNPGIFAQTKKSEMTETAPTVKPTTAPTETPIRRDSPFKSPRTQPAPKFGK